MDDEFFNYTRLMILMELNVLIFEEVAFETGISIGYLNRIVRGWVPEIKNPVKRDGLRSYVTELERRTLEEYGVRRLEDIKI